MQYHLNKYYEVADQLYAKKYKTKPHIIAYIGKIYFDKHLNRQELIERQKNKINKIKRVIGNIKHKCNKPIENINPSERKYLLDKKLSSYSQIPHMKDAKEMREEILEFLLRITDEQYEEITHINPKVCV